MSSEHGGDRSDVADVQSHVGRRLHRSTDWELARPMGECILWFGGRDWDAVRGTDRNYVEALDVPTIWVDYPRSAHHPGGRWVPAPWGGGIRVVREDPLIVRITPATPPLSSRPGVRQVAHPFKRGQVRAALRRLGAQPTAVIRSFLDPAPNRWGDGVVEVLLAADDYVAGAHLMGLSRSWLEDCERRTLRRSDVVVAITDGLAGRWRAMGARTTVLPNGCAPLQESEIDRLESREFESPGVVTAGVVGQLSERIDISLLEAVADAGHALLLVGPVDRRWEPDRFAGLIKREGVVYVGQVDTERVPEYLMRMDVGLTPYADSDFNRASFPLKTLEYLGAGLPVVSTDLPASRWVLADMERRMGADAASQHLKIISTHAEFADAVKTLGATRRAGASRARWDFAQRHSWHERARSLTRLVDEQRAVIG